VNEKQNRSEGLYKVFQIVNETEEQVLLEVVGDYFATSGLSALDKALDGREVTDGERYTVVPNRSWKVFTAGTETKVVVKAVE